MNLINDEKWVYFGVTEISFKERFGHHTRETSNTSNEKIALSYQNIYGNSKMLIYYQLLNEVLLQSIIKNTIKCLSEKFYIIKSLNDLN